MVFKDFKYEIVKCVIVFFFKEDEKVLNIVFNKIIG